MSSGFGSTLSGYVGRPLGAPRGGFGRRVMSDREIDAYLAARDAVRRIKRASPLFAPLLGRGPGRSLASGVTQSGRALYELNIDIMCANTSQAKGRVERANRPRKTGWSRN